jgi:hypothetical protein
LFMNASARQREDEIERLVAQAGRLIREAEPGARGELAEAAAAILREEALTAQAAVERQAGQSRQPVNPLAAGLGLLVVGAGMVLLFPFVGVAIMVCGAIAIVWGIAISAMRK